MRNKGGKEEVKGKASSLPSCTKPRESTLTSLLMACMGNTISRTGIRIQRDENVEAQRDGTIFLFTGLGRWPMAVYMDLLSFCYLPARGSAGRYSTTTLKDVSSYFLQERKSLTQGILGA